MGLQALFYVLILGFLFGSITIATRYCLGQFDPITYSSLRLILSTLIYTSLYLFRINDRRFPKDPVLWKRAFVYGVIGDAIPMLMFISALQYLSSGIAGILITFFPVITVIMGHFFLQDERINRSTSFGIFLATLGAVFMAMIGETGLSGSSGEGLLGYLLILGSAASGSASTIYARKFMIGFDTIDTVFIRMLSAMLVTIPLAIFFERLDLSRVTSTGFIVFLYAAFAMASAFFLGFHILKQYGVTVSAMAGYPPPIITSIGGMLLLDEQVTPVMVFGMVLILIGVATINRSVFKRTSH